MNQTLTTSQDRPFLRRHRLKILAGCFLLAGTIAGLIGIYIYAESCYSKGIQALNQDHPEEARDLFQHILAISPFRPEIHFHLARSSRVSGDLDKAEAHLSEFEKRSGSQNEAIIIEQALLRAQRGNIEPVLGYLTSLCDAQHPDTPFIYDAISRGYMKFFRYGEADHILRRWTGEYPQSVRGWHYLGFTLDQLGSRYEAALCYDKAIRLAPNRADLRIELCKLLFERSRTPETRPHLDYLLKTQPDNLEVRVLHARFEDESGRPKEAYNILEEVLRENPSFGPANTEMGPLALKLGKFEMSERCLKKSIEIDPTDFRARYHLAMWLVRMERLEEAAKVEAKVRVMERDIDRMRHIVGKELPKRPKDARLYAELGAILQRAGDRDKTMMWVNYALSLDANEPLAHSVLVDHYLSMGDKIRAEHHRKLAKRPVVEP